MQSKHNDDDFDLETLADATFEMLNVSPGQVIWIWASPYSLDLVEALAFRIRSQSAFWALRLSMTGLRQRLGLHAPEACLPLVPEHELRWLADVSAILYIRDHIEHDPEIPVARARALAMEWIALNDAAVQQGCRRLSVVYPTEDLAAAYDVSLDTLQQRYWRAMDIDYKALDQQQARVAALMSAAQRVRIVSPLGTDLQLRIDGRPILQDTDGLPRGEVYVAPHEDSANGVAVIDRAFVRGRAVDHLRLEFVAGRVVAMEAPDAEGVEALRQLLAVSTGAKDVIAEFAIGLNPRVSELSGDIALDEKLGGSVHIAIGMNVNFGGRNKANLHKDLVILSPTVWLDDVIVVQQGLIL